MTCGLMAPQLVNSGSRIATSAGDGATIGRRIRISQSEEGKGKCKGSIAWDLRKDFFQRMQPLTTRSTFNAISFQQEHTPGFSSFGHGHVARGRRYRVSVVVNEVSIRSTPQVVPGRPRWGAQAAAGVVSDVGFWRVFQFHGNSSAICLAG